ncbi:hypothetical protein DEO72_LG11g2120 [Vigna unguiculata]|uniref:Uncharacterized protein n=1 Tax=Vigna unguiculata TaxID=3917 RepID=A0A4D6NQ61_VIGUN|nr:hypothetical protein DEO72_LG11g2120 [Vigna unguiculata]
MCEKLCYGSHIVMPGGVPNMNIVRNVSRVHTEEGNLSGPIRTGHNQHTHTDNTRQPEPQLKSSSCSSVIPSHNSRDVILSHNSENATCLTPILSHNSRDTFRATTQGTPAMSTSKCLAAIPISHNRSSMCEKLCYGSHIVMPGGVPNMNIVRNVSRVHTEEGNLSGPIRTGHNQHTHTDNTRQPEPQLKSSSCSSVIPSHNSRDVILSHNSENATCLTPILSHNSRDTFRATTQGTPASPPLRYFRSLIDHASQFKHQPI